MKWKSGVFTNLLNRQIKMNYAHINKKKCEYQTTFSNYSEEIYTKYTLIIVIYSKILIKENLKNMTNFKCIFNS